MGDLSREGRLMSFFTGARAKVVLTVAALGLAIPGSLLGSALAHSFDASSSITIRFDSSAAAFKGTVHSSHPLCVAGRTVKVKKRVGDGPDRIVGTDTTGSQGGYSVPKDNPHGHYYAKVQRSESTSYGHSHICRAARSTTINVT
jgi:hypothetical protein